MNKYKEFGNWVVVLSNFVGRCNVLEGCKVFFCVSRELGVEDLGMGLVLFFRSF